MTRRREGREKLVVGNQVGEGRQAGQQVLGMQFELPCYVGGLYLTRQGQHSQAQVGEV